MFSTIRMPRIEWSDKSMRFMLAAFPLVGLVIALVLWGWMALCAFFSLDRMIMGLGVEAMPVHVAQELGADSCVLDVVGYRASIAVGWAYLTSNANPALAKFLEFLN